MRFAEIGPGQVDFEEAWIAQEWFTLVEERMERDGVSRCELARRLGISQPRVTQMLRGDSPPNLATMARVALALGLRVGLSLYPVSDRPRSNCEEVPSGV